MRHSAALLFAALISALTFAGCRSSEPDDTCCPELHFGRGLSTTVGGGSETRTALSTLLLLATTAEASALRVNTACRALFESAGGLSSNDPPCELARESLLSAHAIGVRVTTSARPCRLSTLDYHACIAESRGERRGERREGCNADASLVCLEGKFLRLCGDRCTGPGAEPVTCEGQCEGACEGACTSDAVDCNGPCDGTCAGGVQPNGRCVGSCKGTCASVQGPTRCDGHCSGICIGGCIGTESEPVVCDGTCEGATTPLTCDGVAIRGACESQAGPNVVCELATARTADCRGASVLVASAPAADPTRTKPIADAIAEPLTILLEERARLRLLLRALEPYLGRVVALNDYVPRCASTVKDATIHVRNLLNEALAANEAALRDFP